MKILVAEGERRLSNKMVRVLTNEAYAVDTAYDGMEASELAEINDYDLIVLDQTIPPAAGLELLREWRAAGFEIPIFILAAQSTVHERVRILDTGADDCLPKPFAFEEFLARVRSLLRRRSIWPALSTYRAGDLEMDRAARWVEVGGRRVTLSPKEFALLEYFLKHKDQPVTRTEIVEHVWDSSFDSFSNVINVFVYRLRKKIDGRAEKKLLHTIPGKGYVLRSERL